MCFHNVLYNSVERNVHTQKFFPSEFHSRIQDPPLVISFLMGNTIGKQKLDDLRSYLLDSPDIVVHSMLATYKLFKVFHCAHEGFKHGGVIVKLFIPNSNEEDDIHVESIKAESLLKPYRDATFLIQCRFSGLVHPNVAPYESAEILNKSAILVRQFFGRNLFDRLYSPPRLTAVHQKWLALQILCAVAQLHSVGVIHGDIKSENVFVVGSFHAVLTDLSTFIKPVYLPLNDPVAATSLFFESGVTRRRCFIAPERFIEALTSRVLDEHGRRMTFFDKEFTTDFVRMDIFSAGLTIAELFLEGQHLVDLPELLSYRSGNGFDLPAVLAKISDPVVRKLVIRMTDRDPSKRPSGAVECISELLSSSCSGFSSLLLPLLTISGHPVYANADMGMMLLRANWEYVFTSVVSGDIIPEVTEFDALTELEIFDQCTQSSLLTRGVTASVPPLTAWSKSGTRPLFPHPSLAPSTGHRFTTALIKLWSEGSAVHQTGQGDAWRHNTTHHINDLFNPLFQHDGEPSSSSIPQPTLIPLLVSLLGSTAMACSWSRSKLVYADMLEALAPHASDECISDYMIPYAYELIASPTEDPGVRTRAMGCMATLVRRLTFAETGLFSEYLFPLCLAVDLPAAVTLAAALAAEAVRLSQPDEGQRKLTAIRMFAERIVSTAFSRNHVLEIVTNWRMFSIFDRKANKEVFDDLLTVRLPAIATHPEEASRTTFCVETESLVKILTPIQIDAILLPLLVDCLRDTEVSVVAAAVKGLGDVAKPPCPMATVTAVASHLIPFLRHPYALVRSQAEQVLIESIGASVTPVDQFVFLRHLLPAGCRTLLDLPAAIQPISLSAYDRLSNGVNEAWLTTLTSAEREGVQALLPYVPTSKPVPRLLRGKSSSVSEHGMLVTGQHSTALSVQVVNPWYPSPTPPPGSGEPVLSIAYFKDWRFEVTSQPRPLPDIGCLSNVDGSLASLYGQPAQAVTSLQARHLATLPCVPSQVAQATWKPESLLLATLSEFCSSGYAVPVVSVDCTDDGRVIVAAGADGTIRLWRTSALETESVVQSSRLIRVPNCSRLFRVKTLRNTKSVAVGNDTRILVYRIDSIAVSPPGASQHSAAQSVSASSSGVADAATPPLVQSPEHRFGHVLSMDCFDTDFSSCVIAACEKGGVVNWDIRTSKLSWTVDVDPIKHGVMSGLVLSKNGCGMVVSTLGGSVVAYDTRYLKALNEFSLSTGPISAICHSATPNSVWVSAGNEVSLFDIVKGGDAKSVLSVNPAGAVPVVYPVLSRGTTGQRGPDMSVSRLIRSDSNARCIQECAGMSPDQWTLLSGHNDGVVRYWNPSTSQQQSGIAYPLQLEPATTLCSGNAIGQRTIRDTDIANPESAAVAGQPCTVTEGHRDVINDLCIASLQYDIVVTAGRDGLIKLWK